MIRVAGAAASRRRAEMSPGYDPRIEAWHRKLATICTNLGRARIVWLVAGVTVDVITNG